MALQVLYHFDIVEFYSDHLAIVEFFYCKHIYVTGLRSDLYVL